MRSQPALPLGLGTLRALMDDVRAGPAAAGTGGLQEKQVGLEQWSNQCLVCSHWTLVAKGEKRQLISVRIVNAALLLIIRKSVSRFLCLS